MRKRSRFEFRVLGPLEVLLEGRVVPVGGPKPRLLLAALLLDHDRVVSADALTEVLWGDAPPARASATLQVYVSMLRRVLGGGAIEHRPPGYLLRVDPESIDAYRFQQLVALAGQDAARSQFERAAAVLTEALRLWRGRAYGDVASEDFVRAEAARLDELRACAIEQHFDCELELGRHGLLVPEIELEIAARPFREKLREQVMVALYRSGRQADALAAYRDARRLLAEELGVEPGPRLQRLRDAVLAHDPALEWRPRAPKHNLPAQLTSFVGRLAEIAQVVDRLGRDRLVTIAGPGGAGKTRLALEVATRAAGDFDDVRLAELAGLSDGAHVAPLVLQAFGLSEQPDRAHLDTLADSIGSTRVLLVLDNCEHLFVACGALVERLLRTCPGLTVLATSREALSLPGETVYQIPPLSVPPAGYCDTAACIEGFESVTLFVDRAARASPGFALDGRNVPEVAAICRRLDGMPMAIELAAASCRALAVDEIARRLGDSLDVLGAGGGGRGRHRTLRAVIDWSHDLLTEGERRMLARLSVFAGGFTLDVAESVCSTEPGEPSPVEFVARLVDKSLVSFDARIGRYRLLETVRQYAAEKLRASDEFNAMCKRHAAAYLALAEASEPKLYGAGLCDALSRLGAEHDNLRAVFEWMAAKGAPREALRFAGALARYCYLRGHYREGRSWLERALACGSDADAALVAKAVQGAGSLAYIECDYEHAASLCGAALSLYRKSGDERGAAHALTSLGAIAREQARYDSALALHREAMEIFECAGDRWGVAHSLQMSGFAAWLATDYALAAQLSGRSLEMFQALGDGERSAWALLDLGAVAHYKGDDGRAADLLHSALNLFEEVGFKEGIAWSLNMLAVAEPAAARELLHRSLSLHRELGDRWRVASVLEALAGVEAAEGDSDRAVTLLKEADAVRGAIGTPVPQCERDALRRTTEMLVKTARSDDVTHRDRAATAAA